MSIQTEHDVVREYNATEDDSVLATVVSEKEYRFWLQDKESTPEEIQRRLRYIETFCRDIIRTELKHDDKDTDD